MHQSVFGLAVCSLLFSCATVQSPQFGSNQLVGYFRGGAYFGSSESEDDVGNELEGVAFGGRVEIGRVIGPHFEIGGRLSIGGQESDLDLGGGVTLDSSSVDIFIEPVIRSYFTTAETRPYAEAFVGYAFSDFDFSDAGGSVSGDGDGLTFGAGAGVEFGLGNNAALALGAEVRATNFDVDVAGFSGDLDRTDILGTVTFVKRW